MNDVSVIDYDAMLKTLQQLAQQMDSKLKQCSKRQAGYIHCAQLKLNKVMVDIEGARSQARYEWEDEHRLQMGLEYRGSIIEAAEEEEHVDPT